MTNSDLQEDFTNPLAHAAGDAPAAARSQKNKNGAHATTSDLVCDCRRMLRYASKNGIGLSAQLVSEIATLDSILVAKHMEPVSDIAEALVAPLASPRQPAPGEAVAMASEPVNAQTRLLLVHQELSSVIAPTTALTLAVSEPSPGNHRLMGGVPLVVKTAAMLAVVTAVLFMTTAQMLANISAATPNRAGPYSHGQPDPAAPKSPGAPSPKVGQADTSNGESI